MVRSCTVYKSMSIVAWLLRKQLKCNSFTRTHFLPHGESCLGVAAKTYGAIALPRIEFASNLLATKLYDTTTSLVHGQPERRQTTSSQVSFHFFAEFHACWPFTIQTPEPLQAGVGYRWPFDPTGKSHKYRNCAASRR